MLQIGGQVQHAHPECGNGVTWSLELRRGCSAAETREPESAHGSTAVTVGPVKDVAVQPGDLVSLLIGPRDGNHACDLTSVELTLAGGGRQWSLAKEVSPDILAGNPHADAHGNPGVWNFYSEPDKGGSDAVIPAGSLLAQWQSAAGSSRQKPAGPGHSGLAGFGPPGGQRQPGPRCCTTSLPRCGDRWPAQFRLNAAASSGSGALAANPGRPGIGPDPALFGKQPGGPAIDPASIAVQAPRTLEIRLPADLVAGCEFVTGGTLEPTAGAEGSVQLQLLASKPGPSSQGALAEVPVLVRDRSASRRRFESAFELIRQVFPPALCYTKIVPVDEVITLTPLLPRGWPPAAADARRSPG